MPHGAIREIIPATSEDVFRLLHDYERRLEWDTLLQDARLCEGACQAALHVISICTSRGPLGGIPMQTKYISFRPPHVAAVTLVNQPPFFASFAASIRHIDLPEGRSSIEYRYRYRFRPSLLRWFLEPLSAILFRRETRKRLNALRNWFERRQTERGDKRLVDKPQMIDS